jgi:hypothetical protein
MRPFCSCSWAFDHHMVNLAEVQIGASSDCVDGFEGWEVVALL